MEDSKTSLVFKSARARLIYALIILSSFFVYCEDEPDEPNQQFAVWKGGGEKVSIWVDVYRSGSANIFFADYTGEPDKTLQLNEEQLNAMDEMEADFGNYLSNYPSVVCRYDGDWTYRVILKTTPSDTTWTCGTANPAIPLSLSKGLNVLNELIDNI